MDWKASPSLHQLLAAEGMQNSREPLTLAAKRHRRDARAVIDAFRALEEGYPAEALVEAARIRSDPGALAARSRQ